MRPAVVLVLTATMGCARSAAPRIDVTVVRFGGESTFGEEAPD
jgi:hypothetical protein